MKKFSVIDSFSGIVIKGKDHVTWLHGQCSTNLKSQALYSVTPSTLNSPKGKTLALIHILKCEHSCVLLLPSVLLNPVIQQLQMYLLSEDVQLLELQDCAYLTLKDPCPNWQSRVLDLSIPGPGFVMPSGWKSQKLNFSWFNDESAVYDQNLEQTRILEQYPLPGSEYMDADTLTPELGSPELISYDKGCFLGQEVFARIRTYGRTNRTLSCLRFPPDERLTPGKAVYIGDATKGVLTSSVLTKDFMLALGYLPSLKISPEAAVNCEGLTGSLILT